MNYTDKALFNWISVIRLPDFITKEEIGLFIGKFMTIDEGLCIRIMHLGAYKIVKKY